MARSIAESFDMLGIYATYPEPVNAACSIVFTGGYAEGMSPSKHTPEEKEEVGEQLAKARARTGLNQESAAALLGITKAALSAWETGRNLPDALMIRRLATAYTTSADALLWDEPPTDALRFAVEFASLTAPNQRKFAAMWKAYYAEAVSEQGPPTPHKDRGDGPTRATTGGGFKAKKSQQAVTKTKKA